MNIRVMINKYPMIAITLSLLLSLPAGISAQESVEPDIPEPEPEFEILRDVPFSPREPDLPPHWSAEIKTGEFEPDIRDWQTFYGDESADETGVAVAYKVLRWLEVGLEFDYVRDSGTGQLSLDQTLGGDVTFNLYPVHAYVLLRGIFHENQRIVPYVGGGSTRAYYRIEIDNQPSRRGDTDGEHVRAGLQILLDWLDREGASRFEEDIGVDNTYLILEAREFSAEIDGIELGGRSAMIGLLFEF